MFDLLVQKEGTINTMFTKAVTLYHNNMLKVSFCFDKCVNIFYSFLTELIIGNLCFADN